MGAIDELLPRMMMDSIQISLVMIGILVMVLIVNPIMIAALACAILLFAGIIKLYMRPAQDLKRLEGICKWFSRHSLFDSPQLILKINNHQFIRSSESSLFPFDGHNQRFGNDSRSKHPTGVGRRIRWFAGCSLSRLAIGHVIEYGMWTVDGRGKHSVHCLRHIQLHHFVRK